MVYKFIIYLFPWRVYTIPSSKKRTSLKNSPKQFRSWQIRSTGDDSAEITLESKARTRRGTCVRISLPLSFHVSKPKGGRERTVCNKTIQYPSTRPPPGLTALPPRWRFYPATLLTPALSFVVYKPRILINSPFPLLKYRISICDADFSFFFHGGKNRFNFNLVSKNSDSLLNVVFFRG